MNATTVAVDLAKSVFQLAVADDRWRVVETHRLTRTQFERWFANRDVRLVIMEACGSAHHWARWLNRPGHRSQAAARPVCPRLRETQQDRRRRRGRIARSGPRLRHPPRAREVGRATSLAGPAPHPLAVDGHAHLAHQRLRGFCREFGIPIPSGRAPAWRRSAGCWLTRHRRARTDTRHGQPADGGDSPARSPHRTARTGTHRHGPAEPSLHYLLSVPGIGLLTATAMVAATSGDVSHFKDARHFASWFGLTPKEYSSGNTRHLGRISKKR
jgi:transposase